MMFLKNDISSLSNILTEGHEATKEGDELIAEAIIQDAMTEAGTTTLSEDVIYELLNEEILNERNILKWDKKAKRKYATNKSVLVIAKEKNDPDYKKLKKVMKMRKKLLDRLFKKYGTQAKARAYKIENSHGMAKIVSMAKNGNVHVAQRDQ
jgi:hypothetical protein